MSAQVPPRPFLLDRRFVKRGVSGRPVCSHMTPQIRAGLCLCVGVLAQTECGECISSRGGLKLVDEQDRAREWFLSSTSTCIRRLLFFSGQSTQEVNVLGSFSGCCTCSEVSSNSSNHVIVTLYSNTRRKFLKLYRTILFMAD